jgi:hypothetical protein
MLDLRFARRLVFGPSRNPHFARHAALVLLLLGLIAMLTPSGAWAQATATLFWTAPGDDGTIGTANRYELRYSNAPVTGDTLAWWNSATSVSNMPRPGNSGSSDSVTVDGLTPSRIYYFLLRAADEVPNWSGFSDLAVRAPDLIPPAAIDDLSITQISSAIDSGNSTSIGHDRPDPTGGTPGRKVITRSGPTP